MTRDAFAVPTPDQLLAEIEETSEIAPRSAAGVEITAMLKRHGLDVIVWKFESRKTSHSARSRESGGSEVCPALNLNIRRQADYDVENIDPHAGNWDDTWVRTEALRADLNAILTRHGYGDDFVAARAFLFVRSWEERVFDLLGRLAKKKVMAAITALVPAAKDGWFRKAAPEPKHVFWHSSKLYFVVFATEEALKRALPFQGEMEDQAAKLIRAIDVDGYCSDTRVSLRLMHVGTPGISLHGMSRED